MIRNDIDTPPEVTTEDVKAIRQALGLSQASLARLIRLKGRPATH